MIKSHYIFFTFITTLYSCKGNNDSHAGPMPADSVVAIEPDTSEVIDSNLMEANETDSLSLLMSEAKETDTSPPKVKYKTSKAYDEGYEKGYDDGYEDAVDRNAFQESYDESTRYKGKKLIDYEEGYDDGYDDGWYDGKADDNDSQEDEEYDY